MHGVLLLGTWGTWADFETASKSWSLQILPTASLKRESFISCIVDKGRWFPMS